GATYLDLRDLRGLGNSGMSLLEPAPLEPFDLAPDFSEYTDGLPGLQGAGLFPAGNIQYDPSVAEYLNKHMLDLDIYPSMAGVPASAVGGAIGEEFRTHGLIKDSLSEKFVFSQWASTAGTLGVSMDQVIEDDYGHYRKQIQRQDVLPKGLSSGF